MVEGSQQSNPHAHKSRRTQLSLQIIVAAVIFASGIIVGVGGTILLVRHRVLWIHHYHKEAVSIARQIKARYNLTEQQAKKVEDVFARAFENRKAVRRQLQTKFDAEREKLVSEMKAVLTPQQFEKWHIDFQKRVERYKKRRNYDREKTK